MGGTKVLRPKTPGKVRTEVRIQPVVTGLIASVASHCSHAAVLMRWTAPTREAGFTCSISRQVHADQVLNASSVARVANRVGAWPFAEAGGPNTKPGRWRARSRSSGHDHGLTISSRVHSRRGRPPLVGTSAEEAPPRHRLRREVHQQGTCRPGPRDGWQAEVLVCLCCRGI